MRVVGTPEPGKRLDVTFRKSGDRTMTLHPTVTVAEPCRELRWVRRLVVPGLFDAEHSFRVEPLGDGRVRLVQTESFRRLLVPFLRRMIDVDTLASFEGVGEALAGRAAELAKEPVG
ncbi:MAG: SRPBCC domain-containing protein [Actinomycetota bacterium]